MAKVSSGSFKTTGYEGRCLKLEWWTNSRNSETNKTNIGYKVSGADGTDGYWYYSAPFEVIINGQKVYSSSTRIKLYKGTIVTSGTLDIEHTSDGSKSFSASVRGAIYSSAYNCSGSGSWDLVDIPLASKVTGGSGDIGKETTINISRASANFIHTLKYEFGSLTDTIATNVATSHKWTIPTTFYSQVIGAKSGKGKIICETYNGTKLIGTSEVEFTANVIDSDPVAGTFTYKDNNDVTTEITEDNQLIIRNNSILLFNIGTATAKNSATISKYEVTFNGVTQSLTKAGTLNFGIINLSNNSKAILKITDSRGFTTTKEIEVKMLDWEIPKGIVSAKRKNNFYSETALKVDGTYSDLNGKNTLAIQYICRRVDLKESSYDGDLEDNKETIVELDNNYQWHIQFFISDRLGQSTYNVYIDRGIPLIFFDRLLNAVGINKFPSDGFKLDIDGNARGNNLPMATGLNNITSFDDVGEGGQLFKSGLYSVFIDNIWYHLLNIRHRNGYTDGTLYGLQIRNRFTIGQPLEYRQQNNGTWTEWQTLGGGFDVDKIYPIGSIYMSVNATDPKNLFGGTWERIQGKFLLGANDSVTEYNAGKTGGNVSHTHDFYNASGNPTAYAKIYFGGSSIIAKDFNSANWTGNAKKSVSGTASTSSVTGEYATELGGATDVASSMPPFLSVYIWKRTA